MKKLSVFFLLLCMVFLNGCIVKNNSQTIDRNDKDYIIYNLGMLPKDLNSSNSDDVRENDLTLAIFEGLVKNDIHGNVVPGLAESWTESKDGLTYKFKIRGNASWSNGNSITAQDFINYFKNILKNDLNSEYPKQLYCVFGAEDYSKGKKDFSGVAINALDSQNIEFRLNSPNENFLDIMSEPYFSLRNPDDNMKNWTTDYMKINYTGPFEIKNVSKNGEISLAKNNVYWDHNNVVPGKLIFTSIESSEEALADYETSKIDVMVNPPLSEVKRLIESNEAYSSSTNVLNSFRFNLQSKSIANDLKFREALQLIISINKNSILKNSLDDIEKATETFVPALSSDANNDGTAGAGASADDSTAKDPTDVINRAKVLIKESKYNNENIKLAYLDSIENDKICEAFKKCLHDSLGINVELISYDYDNLKVISQDGNYDILKAENTDFFTEEASFLQRWQSGSIFNTNGYKNYNYDLILNKIENEKDKNKKAAYIQSAESILNTDIPEIPFYYSNLVICKNSNTSAIDVTSKGNLIFTRASYKN